MHRINQCLWEKNALVYEKIKRIKPQYKSNIPSLDSFNLHPAIVFLILLKRDRAFFILWLDHHFPPITAWVTFSFFLVSYLALFRDLNQFWPTTQVSLTNSAIVEENFHTRTQQSLPILHIKNKNKKNNQMITYQMIMYQIYNYR